MAHADVYAVRTIDKFKEAHNIVKVVQRFADTHKHDIGDGQAGIQLGKEHLVEKF